MATADDDEDDEEDDAALTAAAVRGFILSGTRGPGQRDL
jgi:hypothetical protein